MIITGTHPSNDRNCGGVGLMPDSNPTGISAIIYNSDGKAIWSINDLDNVNQNLNWPAPLQSPVYAVKDYPRFYVVNIYIS